MKLFSISTRFRSAGAYGGLLLFALFLLMPWQPAIGRGLDYAWALSLNLAYEQGLQFGRDAIFTYGPWGFVEQAMYYPGTRALVLVLNAFLIVLWATSVWLATVHWMGRQNGCRALAICSVIGASMLVNPWFTLVFSTGFMIAIMPCRMSLRWDALRKRSCTRCYRISLMLGWTGLMIFAGVASQMKLTYNVLLAACIGVMVLAILAETISKPGGRRSRLWVAVWLPAVYVITWLVAWVGIGQHLSGIGSYIKKGKEIITSYGDAMSYPGPWWQGLELFLVAICVFGLAVRVIQFTISSHVKEDNLQRRLLWAIRLAGAGGILFVVFKSAIIRQGDGHFTLVNGVFWGITLVCIFSLIGIAIRKWRLSRVNHNRQLFWKNSIISCALIAPAVAGCIVMNLVHGHGPGQYFRTVISIDRWHTMAMFLHDGDATLAAQWQEKRDAFRHQLSWGSLDLTTDIYPTRLDIGILAQYPMALRPTLQGYAAANKTLLRMNADHLLDVNAPQQIVLMDEPPVDHQYPAFSDSLSWPWLLTHYDLVQQKNDDLVLLRNDHPRQMRMELMGSEAIQLNKGALVPPVPPGAQGIWATITLKPSFWGKLRGVFYKRPVMIMDIILMDDSRHQARFMPNVASAGFLLSPKIQFGPPWIAFASGGMINSPTAIKGAHALMQKNQIKAIRITPIEGVLDWPSYEDDIQVEYWRFDFVPQPLARR